MAPPHPVSHPVHSVLLALLVLAASGPAATAACQGDRATAVLCNIAVERTARDLPPLQQNDRLALAAGRHARHMVRGGFFSHITPDGATVQSRLRVSGYIDPGTPWAVGEVLAWGRGSVSPESIVAAWMSSPPHRRVLLSRRYQDVGVGVATGDPFGGSGLTFAAELGGRG